MENIDIKKVIIAIIIILILAIGIFFTVKMFTKGDKNYTLEIIQDQDCKYFAVLIDGKYGVINEKGEIIIEASYKDVSIPNPTKPVFICQKENGSLETINQNKEKIFTDYQKVEPIETNGIETHYPYEKSVLKYEENGKFGIIDFEGKAITKPVYEEIASVKYKEGEILAKKDGKYGVINNKGVELIPFEYEEIEADKYYSGGYKETGYIVKNTKPEGYRYGYINSKWSKLLDAEYSAISRILDIEGEDIYLIVAKDGRYGIIKNKTEETPFEYQSIIYNKYTNLLSVQKNDKYGVTNLKGEVIVPIEYNNIRFSGIYICAKGYNEDTYFDAQGKKVENGYTGMKEIEEQNCYIATNNEQLYGIVDKEGKAIVECKYKYIDYAFDEYFIAYKEEKGLGVIDKEGKIIVDFGYDVLSRIGNAKMLTAVNMSTKGDITTIYSEKMEKIVTTTGANIRVYDEHIEIYNDNTETFINNKGEIKTAKEIYPNNKLYGVIKNKKWGFENISGEIVVPCEYERVIELNKQGFGGVKKDGAWGIINEQGELITECIYKFNEEIAKPEFLGKYYKTYKDNSEMYYTNEVNEEELFENGL